MRLSDLSIKRPITTLMVVLLILLLGLVSFSRLNIDLFPDMSFPVAAVTTGYEGAGPEEIENLITKPLEGVLGTVTNLKSISSVSRAGQSLIILEFNWGTNMDFATLEVREKIDMVKRLLPQGVISPMVFKFDPAMLPIAQFGLGGIKDLLELKNIAQKVIIPRLERIEGVASVNLTGGLSREIRIELDQNKLSAHGLSLDGISNILRMENLNLPAGRVIEEGNEYLIRMIGEFKDIEEIQNLLLPTPQGSFIPLSAVAKVRDTYQEIRAMARMNGNPSVGLSIQKKAGANTVRVTRDVFEEIEKIKVDYENLKITPIMNQSSYIEESISNVGRNAIFGGILAILILYFFLKNIRSTIIVGTAIPISIITTFILIYFSGLTINLMTLGGLALGIGMLVDNSIVVLENIFRYKQQGAGRVEAAKKGTDEVATAIIASTLTTIIVFLPVVFVEGIASQLFRELALTVTFSLLASLGIALTFIPMVSSQLLSTSKGLINRYNSEGRFMKNIRKYYLNILKRTIEHPWIVFGAALIVLLLGINFLPLLGKEFIPSMDQGEIRISLQLPPGSVLARTDEIIGRMEEEVLQMESVETVFATIGSQGNFMRESDGRPEIGEILIKLKDRDERTKTTAEVVEDLRKKFNNLTGVTLEIKSEGMFGQNAIFEKPISIQLAGPDLNVLKKLTKEVIEQIKTIPGVRDISHTMEEGQPELQVYINREKAFSMGLSTAIIASVVNKAINGDVPTQFKVNGEEHDLRLLFQWDDRKDIEAIKNILLTSPVQGQIPLGSVVDLKVGTGPGLIERSDGTRVIEITAGLFNRDTGMANEEIKELIEKNVALPDEYSVRIGGQYKEMLSAFDNLGFALILAIILVYMVLAAQFESLLYPLTIMLTVPLALIGAVLGLLATGYTLSVVTIIGMILLAGIVVNNAIVLVDYINTLRSKGKDLKEAIMEAGPVRLRPILMTSLTTILGLLPLALGIDEGSETQAPLAIVVISGLAFSTVLTLIVIPDFYILLDRLGEKLRKIYASLQKD